MRNFGGGGEACAGSEGQVDAVGGCWTWPRSLCQLLAEACAAAGRLAIHVNEVVHLDLSVLLCRCFADQPRQEQQQAEHPTRILCTRTRS